MRRTVLKRCLTHAAIESSLHLQLAEHFNAEIVSKTIETKQDALDWLTWSYLYRRLPANPKCVSKPGV